MDNGCNSKRFFVCKMVLSFMKKNYKKERHAPYIRYAHRTTKLKKYFDSAKSMKKESASRK